jgi:hypothetical protein
MPGQFGNTPQDDGVAASTESPQKNGVFGFNDAKTPASAPAGGGVFGLTFAPGAAGVFGANNSAPDALGDPALNHGRGVQGNGPEAGVGGFSDTGVGVLAQSSHGDAIRAVTFGPDKSGIFAQNSATSPTTAPGGSGVFGVTTAPGAAGVFGANNSPADATVTGSAQQNTGRGVQGNGPQAGVGGFSTSGAGVIGQSDSGVGILAQAGSSGRAGRFEGNVEITGSLEVGGDITLLNADCAEEFDLAADDECPPGTVVVLDREGRIRTCTDRCDPRVVGVISGLPPFRPAMILDHRRERQDRRPVALIGKVTCKVDASSRAIAPGDLLTTSSTPGHAMRAGRAAHHAGAILGKALRPLSGGLGEIPVLVMLH